MVKRFFSINSPYRYPFVIGLNIDWSTSCLSCLI
jgi:hypothetical protein